MSDLRSNWMASLDFLRFKMKFYDFQALSSKKNVPGSLSPTCKRKFPHPLANPRGKQSSNYPKKYV